MKGVIAVGSYRSSVAASTTSPEGGQKLDWTQLGSRVSSGQIHIHRASLPSPPRAEGGGVQRRGKSAKQHTQLGILLRAIESFDRYTCIYILCGTSACNQTLKSYCNNIV